MTRPCEPGERETVLFAVVGMTPAVLTETVWALSCLPEPLLPGRVVVLTTTSGRDAIRRQLFTNGPDDSPCGWERLLDALGRRGLDLEHRLRFGLASDHVRLFPSPTGQADLSDIGTTAENAAAADFILHELRSYTETPQTTVLASLAGGRKTMSALLLSCLSLLGRAQDRALHVLVNPPFDAPLEPAFLFPEKGVVHRSGDRRYPSSKARIELIDVPFVRMRGWYEGAFKSAPPGYAALVRDVQAQAPAPQNYPKLTFECASGELRIDGGMPVSLSPTEFAVCVLLCQGVAEHACLAEALAGFAAKPDQPNTPDWVCRLKEGGRFKAGDVESVRKSLSSARAKFAVHPLLAPLADTLVPKRGKPHRYPPAKLAFAGPDVFADIRG